MESGTEHPQKKSWKKRALLFLSIFITIFFAIYYGWKFHCRKGSEKAAGIYVTTGGESCIEIERGKLRSLEISRGRFLLNDYGLVEAKLENCEVSAEYSQNTLFLQQTESYNTPGSYAFYTVDLGYYGPSFVKSRCIMKLSPSITVPGDWDLVDAEISIRVGGARLLTVSKYWAFLKQSPSIKVFRKRLSMALKSEEFFRFELDPAKGPYHSFLHHIQDRRVMDYFSQRLEEDSSEKTLEVIRDIAKDHPGDPYIQIHLVEQKALHGNLEKAEALLKDWKKKNSKCSDIFLREVSQKAERFLSMEQFKKTEPDIIDILNHAGMRTSLEQLKQNLISFFEKNRFFYLEEPIVIPVMKPGYKGTYSPNYLDILVKLKIMRTLAIFDLFLGKREESLELLAASYRFGQCINSNPWILVKIIGGGMRMYIIRSLEIFLLNACETEEDTQKFMTMMQRLQKTEGSWNARSFFDGQYPLLPSSMKPSGSDMPHYLGGEARVKTADVRFQLLLPSAAARCELIRTGVFPKTEGAFLRYLPDGIPEDVFSEGNPLRFTQDAEDEFIVYSVGPDKTDDKAAFSYDPTNGEISSGDILIRIPKEREFPFPKEGVKAKNAYELLEQFPNGLPMDRFADYQGVPLSIIESNETQPVVIFSFGPDTDESAFIPGSEASPGEFEPVPTPNPGTNPSYGRTLQKVMRRGETIPAPPGYWTLEPMYDPTNGANSNGDLFIEIPR